MDTWLLCQDDMVRLLNVVGRDALLRRLIETLEAGFTDLGHGRLTESPMRTGFTRSGAIPGVIETMPHREPGLGVTVKTVSYSPRNVDDHHLPTILGTVTRIDDNTGRLIALTDGVLLTALRTGAASAVATRRLAHPDARVVGLIGTGAQAVTQLHGLSQVLDIERVLVFDTEPLHAKSFLARAAFLGLEIEQAAPEQILAESDVICTATSVPVGAGPVFPDGAHKPHLHINSIGADEIGKTELPASLLRRALVCVDHREQARNEGECQQLAEDEIGPSLAYLCAHPEEWAHHRESLTVFDSTGVAFEDHLALDVLMSAAEELGLGTKIAIECHPDDVLDPYSLPGHVPTPTAQLSF
ncbi:ornithine cyclodeaminase family protein [Kribbella sandramycini]|uniref:Alanine dehydrogenase n=1 Tax=Kribbella sandramycini TaxID=60450 RepID=A0A7Y4NZV5_9ACTN|nr:ornithine cyclodeaminase family protein [Kribbella sandramycini]MBB6569694.1 alanine dehydrogenase [Kribbella sandramycini]NOL40475.1 ornithine cyclodeaminase family protein [Kribbella sandramycini]